MAAAQATCRTGTPGRCQPTCTGRDFRPADQGLQSLLLPAAACQSEQRQGASMNTVDADAVVGCDAAKAERRLQLLFSQPRRLVVGPGRGRIHKQVQAVLGPERRISDRTQVVNLRWDV